MNRLRKLFGTHEPEKADVVVALGGDGLMLQTMHRFVSTGLPIYGMNRGTVGFLMNDFSEKDLPARLHAAELTAIHPLRMTAVSKDGKKESAIAFNEVSLLRQRHQAAKIQVVVDGQVRLDELACDGILLATPVGQHGLQSFCPWSDPADRLTAPRLDPDQRLPPAALAWRHPAAEGKGQLHHP